MVDVLSQDDLNVLLGLTGEEGAASKGGSAPLGAALSQDDLDALLCAVTEPPAADLTVQPAAPAEGDHGSDSLSQDDIDKLLAEFGN